MTDDEIKELYISRSLPNSIHEKIESFFQFKEGYLHGEGDVIGDLIVMDKMKDEIEKLIKENQCKS